ncbi:MAG: AAA family ATPase, partial [Pseudomonadota bacterium]
MRPLILKMQAFGPYADRQVIDFRPALESGLFGIYGATGSGKSSIFSAMTFALFGEAAKGEQLARTLRSDHADADVMTEVELIFEVGDQSYRLVRRPDQIRPAKRGGGETEEKHSAWLFDVTGLDLKTIDDDTPGKPLAERKVNTVNAAVIGLLGYDVSQFRQIVLLPQGRFEIFLNAKTDERVAILRDLFDVSAYRALTERLKERAKNVRNKIIAQRDVIQSRLESEGFESIETLDDGIAAAIAQCETLAAAKTDAEAAFARAEAAYQQAAQTDKHFAEHAEAQGHVQQLDKQSVAIKADTARLKSAQAAAVLLPKAEAMEDAKNIAKAARQTRDEETEKHQASEASFKKESAALTKLNDQSSAIEKHKDQHRELKSYMELLAEAEVLRSEDKTAATDLENHEQACLKATKTYEAAEKAFKSLGAQRDAARDVEKQRSDVSLK